MLLLPVLPPPLSRSIPLCPPTCGGTTSAKCQESGQGHRQSQLSSLFYTEHAGINYKLQTHNLWNTGQQKYFRILDHIRWLWIFPFFFPPQLQGQFKPCLLSFKIFIRKYPKIFASSYLRSNEWICFYIENTCK